MIKKHTATLLACAILTATAAASTKANEITFELEVLKMEPGTADFLEKRLLEGGDGALQAEFKLPDLIEKGTIRQISQLEFDALNNVRHKSDDGGERNRSSDGIEFVDGSLAEGLTIETENAVGPGGVVSLIYTLTYVARSQGEIIVRKARNVIPLIPGRRTLLHRYKYTGNSVLLITAVQKSKGPDHSAGSRATTKLQATIHNVARLYRVPNVKCATPS